MVMTPRHEAAAATYRRDLGNGLVLRWSTAADTANIAQFVGLIFRNKESDPSNEYMSNEIHELMSDKHPLMSSGDYGVVEDTRKEGNPIVACTCLWRNHWEYEGIPFDMGQPEIVATDPNYRNKGLIRVLFEMVQARSESEGHMVQAITGIPYFYRQFGYEYALDLGGKRVVYTSRIPKAKEGEAEAYMLRDAMAEDVPTIQNIYSYRRKVGVISANVPDYYWLYELQRVSNENEKFPRVKLIVDTTGKVYGYIFVSARRYKPGNSFDVYTLDVLPEVNVRAILPPILRALQVYGSQVPIRNMAEQVPLSEISLNLGRTHPVYDALGNGLAPFYEAPYAWYVRVRDLPVFLKHIAPVLERRLEHSVVSGYTGELKIDLYKGGLHMVFEHGKLTTTEYWRVPAYDSNAGAGFPPLVFLQLLFCHRSLDELRYAFPDVWAEGDTEVVLKALFPAQPSSPLPL
ncbi:MAG: hypothetical protein NVSMB38_17110 [Ktedonobacteraceae bacterium]